MSENAVGRQPWSRRRWVSVFCLLFFIHIFLLGWFGARTPSPRRTASLAPQFRLPDAAITGVWALTDPTLFARGHPRGFSGAAWMSAPKPGYQPPEWSGPPRWLALDAQALGWGIRHFLQTNPPVAFDVTVQPELQLSSAETHPITPATAAPSSLRVEGPLAARSLLHPPALRGWPQADLLTNSIVHVLVNADGNVLSEVLLVSSGLREADEEALRLAGTAQFTPLSHDPETHRPVSRLAWGTLVFEWQTLPPGDDQPATKP